MSNDAHVRTISGPGARLAVTSSVLGLVPELPPLGRVLSGRALGYDLALASRTSLEIDAAGSIALDAEGLDREQLVDLHPNETRATLALDTGSLAVRWSHAVHSVFAKRHDVRFQLDRWEWTTARRPVAWIGALSGARVGRGNMVTSTTINGKETGACGCECFEGGGLRWMIVPRARGSGTRRESYDVVIEPIEGVVDGERVRDALRAVSFVLGRFVDIDVLVGVDETLEPVAAIAVQSAMGVTRPGGERPPLPSMSGRERWPADLFRRLADRIRADEAHDADITHLATVAHLDSERDYIEGAYLKLQVALEAFCARAGGAQSEEYRADPHAWNAWVDSKKDEIRDFVRTDEDFHALFSSLKGLSRVPSSRTVERYFQDHGVTLPARLAREMREGRNRIAHRYSLGARSENYEREIDRIANAQTVLVAALALFVGYEGPITNGRDWYGSPDWWSFKAGDASPRELIRCVAEPGKGPANLRPSD